MILKEMLIKFTKNFLIKLDILNKHVPIAKFSVKETKSNNNPWPTNGILESIHQTKCYLQGINLSQKSQFQRNLPLRI